MKRQGVFLLPPGWDASPSQGNCHKAMDKIHANAAGLTGLVVL